MHFKPFHFRVYIVSFVLIVLLGCGGSKQEHVPIMPVRLQKPRLLTNIKSNSNLYALLDTTIVRFAKSWDIKGISVAVSRYGKLVYAKGFGYANVEEKEPMQPYHMLRVASVSKLISAIAVMRLVEEGRLGLNDTVFGPNGILNSHSYLGYVDKRVEQITIKNLMNHSAGWTTRWGDHLFMPEDIARGLGKELPVTKFDIISFALSKRMHFNPGTQSSYVNLGYLILEDVIEKVAGMPYEQYVKGAVLRPLDIEDAFIAQNYDSLRYAHEVRYYEAYDAEPSVSYDGKYKQIMKSRGGNDIRTLGAAGGWIISSVSLAKLINAIDTASTYTIISKESITALTETDSAIHPLGWRMVTPDGSRWRTGSFSGTSATIVARPDGFTYVFLTNTSAWLGPKFPNEVNRAMARGLQRVKEWPDVNLFQHHCTHTENYVEWATYPQPAKSWNDGWSYPWLAS